MRCSISSLVTFVTGVLLVLGIFSAQADAQTLTTLASFNIYSLAGSTPIGSLTLSGSTLYGMTYDGEFGSAIFSVPVSGGTPTALAQLHLGSLEGSLTLSGTTLYGVENYNFGNIFSIPIGGTTVKRIVSFNGTNGRSPNGYLTLSADGSTFYGMTGIGGANGLGTVFSVPVGGTAVTTLASFNGANGQIPYGGLVRSGSALYGMTFEGGAKNDGTIFSISTSGGTPTTLLSFDGANGQLPWGNLVASGSTLFGMTSGGGANNDGTIFSIPVGGGPLTTLLSFNGTNGAYPQGSLTLSADGVTLYGMTNYGGANDYGTVFSIPVGGGALTTLASFNWTNGAHPRRDLTLSPDGSTLYGMTSQGGAYGYGTVFALTTPEPSTFALLGVGSAALLACGWWRRRRR